jgi:hypothetical protein
MQLESDLATRVNLRMIEAGRCVYCIHDSWLTDDPELLTTIIEEEAQRMFGFTPQVHDPQEKQVEKHTARPEPAIAVQAEAGPELAPGPEPVWLALLPMLVAVSDVGAGLPGDGDRRDPPGVTQRRSGEAVVWRHPSLLN